MSYSSVEALRRALNCLWTWPELEGPVEGKFGYLRLTNGDIVLCYTDLVSEGETESLGLYMPDRDADGREELIEAVFFQLARFVFTREPFVWARWGQEAGATIDPEDKRRCFLVENGDLVLHP